MWPKLLHCSAVVVGVVGRLRLLEAEEARGSVDQMLADAHAHAHVSWWQAMYFVEGL